MPQQILCLGEAHVPLVFAIDTAAFAEAELQDLNEHMSSFFERLQRTPKFSQRLELCVVVGDSADALLQFAPVLRQQAPLLQVASTANIAQSITLAIESIQERMEEYEQWGVPCQRPLLVLVAGDSLVQETTDALEQALRRILEEGEKNQLRFLFAPLPGLDDDMLHTIPARILSLFPGHSAAFFEALYTYLLLVFEGREADAFQTGNTVLPVTEEDDNINASVILDKPNDNAEIIT